MLILMVYLFFFSLTVPNHFHCIEKSSLDIMLNFSFCVTVQVIQVWNIMKVSKNNKSNFIFI